MVSIKSLDFTQNNILKIPDEIGLLPKLEFLSLSDNKIVDFNINICKITSLKLLLLDRNSI